MQLSPGAFWRGEPPERDPALLRAVKREHFWRPDLDSNYAEDTDPEDLYHATPPSGASADSNREVDNLIENLEDLFSSHLSAEPDSEPEYYPPSINNNTDDFEYVRHLELCLQTPLSEVPNLD